MHFLWCSWSSYAGANFSAMDAPPHPENSGALHTFVFHRTSTAFRLQAREEPWRLARLEGAVRLRGDLQQWMDAKKYRRPSHANVDLAASGRRDATAPRTAKGRSSMGSPQSDDFRGGARSPSINPPFAAETPDDQASPARTRLGYLDRSRARPSGKLADHTHTRAPAAPRGIHSSQAP